MSIKVYRNKTVHLESSCDISGQITQKTLTPTESFVTMSTGSVAYAKNTEILQALFRGLSLEMVCRPTLRWEA